MTTFYVRSRPTATWSTGVKNLGDRVIATSATAFLGVMFEVTTAGTSSGSEPSWNATVGGTTTDGGGVVWTTRGSASSWQALKIYSGSNDRVIPTARPATASNSTCIWKCTTGGTSGGTEPTWPTTIVAGTTTQTDGSLVWTAEACTDWDDANPFMDGLLKDTGNASIKVSAGDTIYVSNHHAETTLPASFTVLTQFWPGSVSNPNIVLCTVDTGQPQPPTTLATTASISITAGNSNTPLNPTGFAYVYGITWQNNCTTGSLIVGSQTGTGNLTGLYLKNCALKLGAGANQIFLLGCNDESAVSNTRVTLDNTPLTFGNSAQYVATAAGEITWKNTASGLNGTMPATFFNTTGGIADGNVIVNGVDLSALGANNLFGLSYFGTSARFKLANCKIASTTTLFSPTVSSVHIGFGSPIIDIINCGDTSANYKLHRDHGSGKVDQEIVIVRSGGASDGTTPISWKCASNANAQWAFPLEAIPIAIWNDNSGSSKTATVQILTDSVTALNNDDIWMELEYFGDSGDPMSSFLSDTKANILASGSAQPSSTATWTTTGITNPQKQQLQVTFTPQLKGPVVAVVKVGKTSATVYVDPVITIS